MQKKPGYELAIEWVFLSLNIFNLIFSRFPIIHDQGTLGPEVYLVSLSPIPTLRSGHCIEENSQGN